MLGVTISILRTAVLILGACLLLDAAPADARPPWQRHGADRGGGAVRWQAGSALWQILAQERMSNAERERLRHDLSVTQRDRGRGRSTQRKSRDSNRMTQQQRDGLRRDLCDANRQFDRNRGRDGEGKGNGKRRRGER